MKRAEGPKRDPAKQRKWEQRTRERARARQREEEQAARRTLGRAKPERPAEGPLTPQEYRRAAFEAAGGRCTVTGRVARAVGDRRFHVHHPLPAQVLRSRRLYGSVYDPRNGLWVWRKAHDDHEAGTVRIPREALPASVWEFCAEMDRLGPVGSQWATALVERYHPSGGDLPHETRR